MTAKYTYDAAQLQAPAVGDEAPPPPYETVVRSGQQPASHSQELQDSKVQEPKPQDPDSQVLKSRDLKPDAERDLDAEPSSTSESSSSSDSEEDADILKTALEFTHRPQREITRSPLDKPVAIPQITNGVGIPFIRAWPPSLASHDITPEDFLNFIDNLNVVATASPPLQLLKSAGGIVSMVPHEWFMVAGMVTQVAAGISTNIVSKTRVWRYLKRANADFFAPRNLRVEVLGHKEMKDTMHWPEHVQLVAPLEDLESRDDMPVSVMERRMQALEGMIAHLELENLPEPSKQTNVLSKLCQKQVQRDTQKKEKRLQKKRVKATRKLDKTDDKIARVERKAEREHRRLDEEANRGKQKADEAMRIAHEQKSPAEVQKLVAKAQKEYDRELADIGDERAKVERKMQRKTQKKEKRKFKKDKENRAANKAMWLVVRNISASDTNESD